MVLPPPHRIALDRMAHDNATGRFGSGGGGERRSGARWRDEKPKRSREDRIGLLILRLVGLSLLTLIGLSVGFPILALAGLWVLILIGPLRRPYSGAGLALSQLSPGSRLGHQRRGSEHGARRRQRLEDIYRDDPGGKRGQDPDFLTPLAGQPVMNSGRTSSRSPGRSSSVVAPRRRWSTSTS